MAEQVGCLAFSSSETSRLAKEDQEEEEEEHEARNETKEKPKTNESQSQQVDTAKKLISLARFVCAIGGSLASLLIQLTKRALISLVAPAAAKSQCLQKSFAKHSKGLV